MKHILTKLALALTLAVAPVASSQAKIPEWMFLPPLGIGLVGGAFILDRSGALHKIITIAKANRFTVLASVAVALICITYATREKEKKEEAAASPKNTPFQGTTSDTLSPTSPVMTLTPHPDAVGSSPQNPIYTSPVPDKKKTTYKSTFKSFLENLKMIAEFLGALTLLHQVLERA